MFFNAEIAEDAEDVEGRRKVELRRMEWKHRYDAVVEKLSMFYDLN